MTPKVALEDWAGEIGVRIPGCPEPDIVDALRRSMQQFCADTLLWTVSLGQGEVSAATDQAPGKVIIPELAGEDEGDAFRLPEGSRGVNAEVLLIPEVRVLNDDGTINRTLRETATREANSRNGQDADDYPYEWDDFTGALTLYEDNIVRNGGTVEILASLRPSDEADEVPDAFKRWKLGIFDRALYELMIIPKREWTDRVTGLHYLGAYNRRVGEGAVAKARKGGGKKLRTPRIPIV